jgi:hypothetical protein
MEEIGKGRQLRFVVEVSNMPSSGGEREETWRVILPYGVGYQYILAL